MGDAAKEGKTTAPPLDKARMVGGGLSGRGAEPAGRMLILAFQDFSMAARSLRDPGVVGF
jgi:hypothetical protein